MIVVTISYEIRIIYLLIYMKIEFREDKLGRDEGHSESQLNGHFLFSFNSMATFLNSI